MGSNVINLDEVVPGLDGITFSYRGSTYTVPGDLPSETVFEFLSLFDDMLEFQRQAQEATKDANEENVLKIRDELKTLTATIEKKLLAVFQIDQPEMKELPFGQKSAMAILSHVLASMGIGSAVGDEPVPTPPAPTPGKRKRTTTSRTRRASGRKTRPAQHRKSK